MCLIRLKCFLLFSKDAEKAIRDMSGAMLKRRPIKTNWATRNQKPQQRMKNVLIIKQ